MPHSHLQHMKYGLLHSHVQHKHFAVLSWQHIWLLACHAMQLADHVITVYQYVLIAQVAEALHAEGNCGRL